MQLRECTFINEGEQLVQPAQCHLHLLGCDEAIPERIRQLVQIHDPHEAVRVDDDICEQIGKDIGLCLRIVGVADDVTVPADQIPVMVIKLADLEAAVYKIAGVAVMQRLLRVNRVPLCNNHFRIPVKYHVLIKKQTFFWYHSFSV